MKHNTKASFFEPQGWSDLIIFTVKRRIKVGFRQTYYFEIA